MSIPKTLNFDTVELENSLPLRDTHFVSRLEPETGMVTI